MKKIILDEVVNYVELNTSSFHQKRTSSLDKLKLQQVLKRKNPYLFKTKHILTSGQLIRVLVDAHISSNEETLVGDWLEGLTIFINNKAFNGRKSSTPGIDLEFDKDNVRYIVSIKSGPNWGNSRQIKKMKTDLTQAKKTLRTSSSNLNVIAVNGCCYGSDNVPDKGDYFRYCGQRFWEFISGDPELYTLLNEPVGHAAKERNNEFMTSYAQMISKFTLEFTKEFCSQDGSNDWEKLVRYNSSED
jgi:hypothetical protein